MGTTLTGTTPQDTYDSLIKVTDNGPLTGSLKRLTDGLGNDSALSLSTAAARVTGNLSVKTTTERANITTDADLVTENGIGVVATSATFGQGYQYMRFMNSTGAYSGSVSHTASTGIGLYSGSDLILASSSTERMRIDSAGQLRAGVESDSDRTSHRIQLSDNTENVLSVQNATNTVGNKSSLGLYLRNSNNAAKEYAKFDAEIITNNAGSENGNLIFSTIAAGTLTERVRITTAGLTFNGDTAAANALDDYEEGTWTPSSNSSGYTISVAAGNYTKIGRQVTIRGQVEFSAVDASSTSLFIFVGLPFAPSNLYQGVCRENSATGAIFMAQVRSAPDGVINSMDGVASGSQQPFAINREYIFTITYFV